MSQQNKYGIALKIDCNEHGNAQKTTYNKHGNIW